MSDLFDDPLVHGLSIRGDIIPVEQEAELIRQIDREGLSPFRFQQWTGKRLTRSFGWSYDFERGSFEPTDPIPQWLEQVRVLAARFASLAPEDLVQALLIRYDPGAGIGWHRDRPVFDEVVGISLGNPATLRLRRRREGGFDRAKLMLAPRSAYHLSGEVRRHWEHSIAAVDATRWSITFRTLSAWP